MKNVELWTFVQVDVDTDGSKSELHEHTWLTAYVMEQSEWLPVTTFCEGCALDADQLADDGIQIYPTQDGPPCVCTDCEDEPWLCPECRATDCE